MNQVLKDILFLLLVGILGIFLSALTRTLTTFLAFILISCCCPSRVQGTKEEHSLSLKPLVVSIVIFYTFVVCYYALDIHSAHRLRVLAWAVLYLMWCVFGSMVYTFVDIGWRFLNQKNVHDSDIEREVIHEKQFNICNKGEDGTRPVLSHKLQRSENCFNTMTTNPLY